MPGADATRSYFEDNTIRKIGRFDDFIESFNEIEFNGSKSPVWRFASEHKDTISSNNCPGRAGLVIDMLELLKEELKCDFSYIVPEDEELLEESAWALEQIG